MFEEDELDFSYRDMPTCPYCGGEDRCVEGERFFEQEAQILNQCEYCEKEYYVHVCVSVTYSSEKYEHEAEVKRIIERATRYVNRGNNVSKEVAFEWASNAQEVSYATKKAAKALYLI